MVEITIFQMVFDLWSRPLGATSARQNQGPSPTQPSVRRSTTGMQLELPGRIAEIMGRSGAGHFLHLNQVAESMRMPKVADKGVEVPEAREIEKNILH